MKSEDTEALDLLYKPMY